MSRTTSDRWRRIEEIYRCALELPQEQREAYLQNCCEDDVLRREVRTLLAREDDESPLIAGIVEGAAAQLFDEDAPPDAMAGAEVGPYRIIREIGRGGMGAVYLAVRADRAFDKQVAIKLVKRGIDTDAVLARFWYERRILAGLEHPYIARLLDGGTSPDGRPYFVMEYVDGHPLDTYVREHRLSVVECCGIFRKICEAVSYAHRNLVIHRDLKPANVLVTADETPKLLDFGIARLLSSDPGEHTIAGPVAARALTPEFASPEQMRGEAVTTATDVYSLGKTLRAILPRETRISDELATIIGKATRDEAEQRFNSVDDLSEDLRRYLCGLPILAREQTLVYRSVKFVERHRVGVAVFALFNLLVIGGITAIVQESRRVEMQRRQAEQRLSQALDMAEQTLKDVNGSIASLPGTTEARRLMVRNTLDYLNKLSKDSGDDPRVLTALATAYVRVGEVLGNWDFPNLGDLAGSLAVYRQALAVDQQLLDKDPAGVSIELLAAETHQGTGDILESLGREQEAEAEYRNAIALADGALAQAPANPDAQYRALHAHYALCWLRYVAHPAEAEKDMRQQLPMAIKLAVAHPERLDAQNKLSEVYSLIGATAGRTNRPLEALVYYRKAIEVREAIYRQEPRNTRFQRSLMIGYGHLGDQLGNPFLKGLGDYRGALEYFQKAERIAEDMRQADPSDQRAGFDLAMVWTRIGATRWAAGDFSHAREDLLRAAAQFAAMMAASAANANYTHGAIIACNYLGRSERALGHRAAALTAFRKSMDLAGRLLADHPGDLAALVIQVSNQGWIAPLIAESGDRQGAIRMAEAAVRNARTDGIPPLNVAQAQVYQGQTYEALNDFSAAAAAYGNAVASFNRTPGQLTSPYQMQLRDAERKASECRARAGHSRAQTISR